MPGQVEGPSPAVCFQKLLPWLWGYCNIMSCSAGPEADPHQLYPKPLLICTSPICAVWPLSPRATTKPRAGMEPCPRAAGCGSIPSPVSPCPPAGCPALDELCQRGQIGRAHV